MGDMAGTTIIFGREMGFFSFKLFLYFFMTHKAHFRTFGQQQAFQLGIVRAVAHCALPGGKRGMPAEAVADFILHVVMAFIAQVGLSLDQQSLEVAGMGVMTIQTFGIGKWWMGRLRRFAVLDKFIMALGTEIVCRSLEQRGLIRAVGIMAGSAVRR